ncbi:MAG: NAD(P)-binding protein [Bacteriovorax sp.]|nr:NAD(P)-binding protein [Rhizobacter sp.]
MNHQTELSAGSVLTYRSAPRVAVIGAGIGGLTCARELRLRGCEPVVFEASGRLGGRCSSRSTSVGWFDDGAQSIGGATRLGAYAVQRPGELAALHPWTVPATPTEDERKGRDWDKDEDEADATRTLKLMGAVGVPSMLALAHAVARPLDVRLHTSIQRAWRRGATWVLRDSAGEIDEDFEAVVLGIPAPLALPLARESAGLAAALRAVRYRSRWVLLLGSERAVNLPGYREFQGSPIERVAAMHSKPGRSSAMPQRWFVEADERWSLQHAHEDAETVADSLLDNFRSHAGRSVTPNFLCAHQWQHAFVETPAAMPGHPECLWDDEMRLGVCGDSVVASQLDRVHRSGLAMAVRVAEGLTRRRERSAMGTPDRGSRKVVEAQAAHG